MIRLSTGYICRGTAKSGFFLLCLIALLFAAVPSFSDSPLPGSPTTMGPFVTSFSPPGGPKPGSVSSLPAFTSLLGAPQASLPGAVLNEEQTAHFEKSVRWMKYSTIALGVNTGALLLSFIAPTAGGIVGILSLGAWSITTGYMAFGYRDLMAALDAAGSDAPSPKKAGYASIGAAAFAMGAITAIWYNNIWFGLIMLIAMVVTQIVGTAFGAMVPLLLRTLRLDPALGSSIFVTTAADVGGFFVFLGLATLLMRYLLV